MMENEKFYRVNYDDSTLEPSIEEGRSLGTGMISGLTHEIIKVKSPHDLKFVGWCIGDPHHSWARNKNLKIDHEVSVIEEKIRRLQKVITQLKALKTLKTVEKE